MSMMYVLYCMYCGMSKDTCWAEVTQKIQAHIYIYILSCY